MAIRPIDVRRKEFKSGFRGYDANQVDDFLDQVADEFERTYTDGQRMREEVSSLRERLQQFEDLESSIRSALVHAEQASNDLRNSAQRDADELKLSSQREAENLRLTSQKEAELTIQEAQNRAHQMLADSSGRVERIQESYEALQDAKRDFKNDFRQILKTYMDVMEDMEVSSAKEIESRLRNRLDTESMAVAREAAASDDASAPDVTPVSGNYDDPNGYDEDQGTQNGPLYGEEENIRSESQAEGAYASNPNSTEETQRIDLSDLQGDENSDIHDRGYRNEGEVAHSDETSDYSGGTENPEETRDDTTDHGNDAPDDFFDRDDHEDRDSRDRENEGEGKIFRASRFLRRRS